MAPENSARPGQRVYRLPSPTRREVLVGLSAGLVPVTTAGLVTGSPAAATTAAGPVTLDDFMRLSRMLTDDVAGLDDEPGALYLASLRSDPTFSGPLRQLVRDTVRQDRPPDTFNEVLASGALDANAAALTAQQILVLWYSGLVDDRTADFVEALAWTTLSFPKPPSTKLGFPKWDEAP
jgi:hypothetical protein